MTDCVLCDWQLDWAAEPIAVYLPGCPWPVRWYPDGPAPAAGSDSIGATIGEVAVVAHWAVEHELQLRLALGRRDWQLRPVGCGGDPPPPPVDTVYGVDLAKDGKTSVIKATKLWIAKAFGVPEWVVGEMAFNPANDQVEITYIDPE